MCMILKENGILIEQRQLINACEDYGYHKQQLIDDLCEIMVNGEDNTILLVQMFSNGLNITNKPVRKQIYDIMLPQYIKPQDVNNNNFIKILRKTVSELYQSIDCDEVAKIAANVNLTGKIFIKASPEFKNSIKFGHVFKSMNNWNKKHWSKIYKKLSKICANKKSTKKNIAANEKKSKQFKDCNPATYYRSISWRCCYCTFNDSNFSNSGNSVKCQPCGRNRNDCDVVLLTDEKDQVDYIDKGTDFHLIQQFCTTTNTSKDVAIRFLQKAEWNITFAINKYYAETSEYKSRGTRTSDENSQITCGAVYNHGVAFWYWTEQRSNKRFVKNRFNNLKEEILQFKQFDT
eukprot:304324_1